MIAILRREAKSYFYSPVAYVFMGFLILVTAIYFVMNNLMQNNATFLSVLSSITFVFMLIVPILTMRLLSEDRRSKTDQMLLTAPLSVTNIVLGKFLAALLVFLLTIVAMLFYPLLLTTIGSPSFPEITTGIIGFFLMGSAFISVGLFISSLVENQVIAAAATFGVLLIMTLLDPVIAMVNVNWLAEVLQWLSVTKRFTDFAMGVLPLSAIVYYIGFASVFVFLTVRAVEKRRWSEG